MYELPRNVFHHCYHSPQNEGRHALKIQRYLAMEALKFSRKPLVVDNSILQPVCMLRAASRKGVSRPAVRSMASALRVRTL